MPHRTRIVILGGGFAGMYAALRLDRTLARDSDIEITLVNRENFFLFTPMLHEVATSDLDPTNIVSPIRSLVRRIRFFSGAVEAVDLPNRRVVVAHGDDPHRHELPYDHLVLALGSTTNFFGTPGLAERAFTMKSLDDAVRLRNQLIRNLEEADFECCAAQRDKLLTFVVAGGGFAGVETVGGLNDFVRNALASYPNLTPEMIRVILIHSGSVLLPELDSKLGRYAQQKLADRGVEVLTNTRVHGLFDRGVHLSNGQVIPSATLVWSAGTAPNPILAQLPCARERGRVVVDSFLEVPSWPGVWALGDCACIPHPETGQPYPPTAQHAVREGKRLADNLQAVIRDGVKKPFAFQSLGQLATIGRRTGVAQIFGFRFSGLFAWWLWRTIYLAKLPRLRKKFRVALDWTLDLFLSKDLVQFLPGRGQKPTTIKEAADRNVERLPEVIMREELIPRKSEHVSSVCAGVSRECIGQFALASDVGALH
jgi:NADH dehydrogenase